MSKTEQASHEAPKVLFLGDPSVSLDRLQVSRIDDNAEVLPSEVDGQALADFRYHVVWPSRLSADGEIAGTRTDIHREFLDTVLPCVATDGIVVVVVPTPHIQSADMQVILRYISSGLSCQRTETSAVMTSLDNRNRSSEPQLITAYRNLTSSISEWPKVLLRTAGILHQQEVAERRQRITWGQVFGAPLLTEVTPAALRALGYRNSIKLIATDVVVLRGHTNRENDPRSLLFVTAGGGVIVMPEISAARNVVQALLSTPDTPLPPTTSVQISTAPCRKLSEDTITSWLGENAGHALVFHNERDTSKHRRWKVTLCDNDVFVPPSPFYILLAHAVAVQLGAAINPVTPRIAGQDITRFIVIGDKKGLPIYRKRSRGAVGKPAQQVKDIFKVSLLEPRRDSERTGPRQYALRFPASRVQVDDLKSCRDARVKFLMSLLPSDRGRK